MKLTILLSSVLSTMQHSNNSGLMPIESRLHILEMNIACLRRPSGVFTSSREFCKGLIEGCENQCITFEQFILSVSGNVKSLPKKKDYWVAHSMSAMKLRKSSHALRQFIPDLPPRWIGAFSFPGPACRSAGAP